MRNRVISAFLAVVMAVAMLPLVPVAAAGYSKSQVDSLMAEWNSGKYAQNKSTSYGGATECAAFTRFLFYELWGHYDREGETKNKLMPSGSDDIPCTTDTQLMNYLKTYAKPGDSFRLTSSTGTHIMHLYDIDTKGNLLFYESNFEGNSKNKARFMVSTLEDLLGGNQTDIATVKNDGSLNRTVYLTIIHASNNTATQFSCVCSHTYVFKNDNSVVCSKCKTAYTVPAPSGGSTYMDIVKVNSTGTAPSHTTPYGDATIRTRYKKGQTVYVVGSTQNAFNNKWYKLSTGDWITGDYLGTHTHKKVSGGFCTLCVDGTLNVVRMNSTTISAKSGKTFPVHFAPYGASLTYANRSGSVTVTGKVVNGYDNVWYRLSDGGWVFGDYLTTPVVSGKVNLSSGALALNDGPGSSPANSKELAAIPAGSLVYIYTGETSGSWYSARYADKVGFVYKNYITLLDGSKQVEAPASNPEPSGDSVDSSGSSSGGSSSSGGGSSSSGVSSVFVQYPTDPNYLSKFAVSDTNATVVANILKPAGSKVTACGLLLYDTNANLIKDHRETITNVGNSLTSFHAWYDIQKDLGLTLTPGTRYLYKIYAVVDGVTYVEAQYSFTTTGSVPVVTPPAEDPKQEPEKEQDAVQYNLIFDPNGGSCDTPSKTITFDTAIGDLPTPIRDGYTFMGWHLQGGDGGRIGEETRYTTVDDLTVTARWSPNIYNLIFNANGGSCTTQSKTIIFDTLIGDMPTPVRSGYTFDGWYGAAEGGNLIHGNMRYNAPFDVTIYAHWNKASAAAAMQDVPEGAWYFNAVDYVITNGLMSGYSANKFGPNDTLNRAMVVQVLYNKEGKPGLNGAKHNFSDVPSGQWFNDAVTWGSKRGVVSGFGGGLFKPDDAVTIEQVAVILHNYCDKPITGGSLDSVGKYDLWAADALRWAVSKGVLNNVLFANATEKATRAQTAQMLTNFMTKVK